MDSRLRSALEELKDDENFVDCYFLIGDKNGINQKFGCNKLIVSCASAVFKAMLTGEWEESASKIINIADVEIDVFEKFRNYIYNYDAKKLAGYTFDDLFQLGHFAQKYMVQSLVGDIVNLLIERLESTDGVLKVFELTENLDNVDFSARIEEFVRAQPQKMLLSKQMLGLGRNSFDKYLEMFGDLVCPFELLKFIESFLDKHGLIPDKRSQSNEGDQTFDFPSAREKKMLAKDNHLELGVKMKNDGDTDEYYAYRRRLISHVDFGNISIDDFYLKLSKSTVLNMKEKYEMLYKISKQFQCQSPYGSYGRPRLSLYYDDK